MRGDSAFYNEKLLTWLDAEQVEFAVTAPMHTALHEAIEALPASAWQPLPASSLRRCDEACADVVYVPEWARNRRKHGQAFRYTVKRWRPAQGELFDEPRWHYHVVVTNRYHIRASHVLRWHSQRQGTVERLHRVCKSELAGGVLPSARFGANAAWWRLMRLIVVLLELLKRPLARRRWAHPKQLRFGLFNLAGRIVYHGGQVRVRIAPRFFAELTHLRAWIEQLASMLASIPQVVARGSPRAAPA